ATARGAARARRAAAARASTPRPPGTAPATPAPPAARAAPPAPAPRTPRRPARGLLPQGGDARQVVNIARSCTTALVFPVPATASFRYEPAVAPVRSTSML